MKTSNSFLDDNTTLLEQARELHFSGDLRQAESCYQKLHSTSPDNPELLNLYGLLNIQLNKHKLARQLFEQSLRIDATDADPHSYLAYLLTESGDYTEAEQHYQQALAIDPGHADSWSNQGILFAKRGMKEQAIDSFKRAIAINGDHVNALSNLCRCLIKLGRDGEAVQYLPKLIKLQADNTEAWVSLVCAWQRLGNREMALELAGQASMQIPKQATDYFKLAEMYWFIGRLLEAAQSLYRAILLEPRYLDAISNLGAVLREMGNYREAESILKKLVNIDPHNVDAYCNLAAAVSRQGRHKEAKGYLRKALKINPGHATAYTNLGFIYWQLADYQQAEREFRRAIKYDPNQIDAHCNLGMVLLSQGKYRQGWREYSWRSRLIRNNPGHRRYEQPLWQGETIDGKTLLIYPEQGLGDIIQFIRYAYLLAPGLQRLIIEVPQSLKRLLSGFQGQVLIISPEDPVPEFDWHIPLLSLPGVMGTQESSIPDFTPYLQAETEKLEYWARRLRAREGMKIGLAWQGNSKNMMDRTRSIALASFLPLFDLDNIQFVSLQKGEGEEQLQQLTHMDKLVSFSDELDSGPDAFIDTAAIIANLDLVITCDSAIAHLAGAMGKPVWLLLAQVADFRWLMQRQDSPWYPSARLFRQHGQDGWEEVIRRVKRELGKQFGTS